MLELYVRIANWNREQEGQDLIEYGVMLGFIALVVWGAVTVGGTEVSRIWNVVSSRLAPVT